MKELFTTKRLALLSLFTALIIITTTFVKVPNPVTGYTNLGDTFIFLGSALFGPLFALISGSIGSALADVLAGFPTYAPFTFIIKGIEGFLSGLLIKSLVKIKINPHFAVLLAFIVGAIEMVFGYFITNTILYGVSAGLSSILSDCVQGLLSVIFAYVLTFSLSKVKVLHKYTNNVLIKRSKDEDSTN